jgi:hypothetical protein
MGMNYVDFAQNGSEAKNLAYSSVAGPSCSLSGGVEGQKLGLEALYASYPGQISSSTAQVDHSNYNWTTQSLEGTYRWGMSPLFSWGHSARFGWRAGLQRHQLPYVQTTSATTAAVRMTDVWLGTLGVDYATQLSEKWRSSMLFRYQMPFKQDSQASDNLTFSQRFAFDGSLGFSYLMTPSTGFGLYWYGQWQEYRYEMTNEATASTDNGNNKYFFSNMELRLEYGF